MANLTVILFLCATVPMLPALYMIPDKRSRLFLGYMLLGMVVCLIASEVNSFLLGLFGGDTRYVSVNISPIAEEVLRRDRGLPEGRGVHLVLPLLTRTCRSMTI